MDETHFFSASSIAKQALSNPADLFGPIFSPTLEKLTRCV